MAGKPGCSSNSLDVLLRAANTHSNYLETGTRSSELKRPGTKRRKLLSGSLCNAKRSKTPYAPGLKNHQGVEHNIPNHRNQQISSNEVLPWPQQDKTLGKYVKNAVKEIKKLEDVCRRKRHIILGLKEKQHYLTRAQQYRVAAKACEINNKYGYHSKDHNQGNIPNDNNNNIPNDNNNNILDDNNDIIPNGNNGSIPNDSNGSTFDIDKIPDLYPIAPLSDNDFQSEIEKIPDLCPINSFGADNSQNDQMHISDKVNMQCSNDNDQTSQLADQPRESLTFFPEYVEMDSTAAAKDLGNDPQKLSSCNANGDSSKHVSVIKVV